MEKDKRELAWQETAYPRYRKWIIRLLTPLLRLLFRPKYAGLEHLNREGPFVIVCNHRRFFDVMLIYGKIPRCSAWLAKAELFDSPIVGEAARRMGAIPVNRDTADIRAIKTSMQVIKNGGILGVFPEGKRLQAEEQGKVLPREGLIRLLERLNVPMVPVLFEGPYRLFRRVHIVAGEAFTMDELAKWESFEPEATKSRTDDPRPHPAIESEIQKAGQDKRKSLMLQIYRLGEKIPDGFYDEN